MKSTRSPKALTVKRLDQMKALAHPLRYRIFERLVVQPGSPKAVALDMGLKETRLYHHFGVLEKAGLIKRTRSQRKRGAIERTYAAAAERIVLDRMRVSGEIYPAGSVAVQALRATIHEVEQCEAQARAARSDADLSVARLVLRLSPARAAEFETRLNQLIAEAQRADGGADAAEYHAALVTYRAAPRPSVEHDRETD